MKCAMGIDSGGTKTLCLVADAEGRIVSRGRGGPGASLGAEGKAESGIGAAMDAARRQLPGGAQIEAVFANVAGTNLDEARDVLVRRLPGRPVQVARETAGDTVFLNAPHWGFNVVVMAGTGSVALGTDHRGNHCRAGGWGCVIDDRGSGFAFGRDALRAATAAIDRRGPPTSLLPLVVGHSMFEPDAGTREILARPRDELSCDDCLRLREVIIGRLPDLTRQHIASLAPLVARAAQAGDPAAVDIVADAADYLARLAAALCRAFPAGPVTPRVTGIGGLFKCGDLLWQPFAARVLELFPAAEIVRTAFDLGIGAVAAALLLAGRPVTPDVVRNLEAGRKQENA